MQYDIDQILSADWIISGKCVPNDVYQFYINACTSGPNIEDKLSSSSSEVAQLEEVGDKQGTLMLHVLNVVY